MVNFFFRLCAQQLSFTITTITKTITTTSNNTINTTTYLKSGFIPPNSSAASIYIIFFYFFGYLFDDPRLYKFSSDSVEWLLLPDFELSWFVVSFCLLMAVAVPLARTPVYGVFFLIGTFLGGSVLIFISGLEFLGMSYVVVYVGAIAVLFLFVIMMISGRVDFDFSLERRNFWPLFVLLGCWLGVGYGLDQELPGFFTRPIQTGLMYFSQDWSGQVNATTNAEVLGQLLYTYEVFAFWLVSLVLFVAMVGAILLTLFRNQYVLHQNPADQVQRKLSAGKTYIYRSSTAYDTSGVKNSNFSFEIVYHNFFFGLMFFFILIFPYATYFSTVLFTVILTIGMIGIFWFFY